MQTTITFSTDARFATFDGPYNGASNTDYHLLKGKWKGKKWVLPLNSETAEFIRRFFGEGTTEITVQVRLDSSNVTPFDSQIVLGGYVLAGRMYARGRVALGEGVRLVSGTFDEVSPDGIARVSWKGEAPVVELQVRSDYAFVNGLYSVPLPDETKREPEQKQGLPPGTDDEYQELSNALTCAEGWDVSIISAPTCVLMAKSDNGGVIIKVCPIGGERANLAERKAAMWQALEIISSINAQNQ
jgi:hypothetical protein